MSDYRQAKRAVGAEIRASVPTQEIRFPRLFAFDEVASMPRIPFSRGMECGAFISREREGARYYSQGIGFHAAGADDVTWQATSWDESFTCLSGSLRVIVTDAEGKEVEFLVEAGKYFWAPAGYKYSVRSTGVEAVSYLTTAPQMPSGWRHTGDDESYSDALIALRP
ncbi:hypothetical protein VX037_23580 [Gordonia sp. Z-3]|uniref:hypothetical protein n=1 Tax=Gordonia sp. Z-3 TaxID=3115408 RepID=UPI002E2CFF4A|nr:hypothetical protein [Gordonia sp. Z-3]MED5804008.1 hypothetical protein [Gordonia sp. Z-3]